MSREQVWLFALKSCTHEAAREDGFEAMNENGMYTISFYRHAPVSTGIEM